MKTFHVNPHDCFIYQWLAWILSAQSGFVALLKKSQLLNEEALLRTYDLWETAGLPRSPLMEIPLSGSQKLPPDPFELLEVAVKSHALSRGEEDLAWSFPPYRQVAESGSILGRLAWNAPHTPLAWVDELGQGFRAALRKVAANDELNDEWAEAVFSLWRDEWAKAVSRLDAF